MAIAANLIWYVAFLLALPNEGKWDFKASDVANFKLIGCRVLAVTEMSITVTNLDKKNKVETYPFHHRLAQGWYNLLDSEAFCYSRSDLMAGDRVCLRIVKKKGEIEACVSVSISERQEGVVPPTRRFKLGDWQPYHERIAAFAKFENDRTPLPYHLGFDSMPSEFPAFDPATPRKLRPKPYPSSHPFTYMEYVIFMR